MISYFRILVTWQIFYLKSNTLCLLVLQFDLEQKSIIDAFFFFNGDIRDGTQDLVCSKHVLYCWAIPNPLCQIVGFDCFSHCKNGYLLFYWGQAQSCAKICPYEILCTSKIEPLNQVILSLCTWREKSLMIKGNSTDGEGPSTRARSI